jgi:cell division septation protein DedD
VQLAALNDEQSARAMWQELRQRYSDLLGGLEAQFEPANASGHSLVRLRAGPVATLAATRSLCEQLRQRGQDCYPVNQ